MRAGLVGPAPLSGASHPRWGSVCTSGRSSPWPGSSCLASPLRRLDFVPRTSRRVELVSDASRDDKSTDKRGGSNPVSWSGSSQWLWKEQLWSVVQRVKASPAFQCMAFVMPSLPGGGWSDLWRNRIFVAGLLAWFLAQFAKIFTKRYKKGVWDLMAFRDSGGMPSSHSAMSMAVTTAIALDVGMASPLFPVALCFTSIVMYDAAGVRKHAGYQAQVLNSLVEHAGLPDTHPFSARKLKEVLGHTPRQVIVGGLLGIAVGMFAPCAAA